MSMLIVLVLGVCFTFFGYIASLFMVGYVSVASMIQIGAGITMAVVVFVWLVYLISGAFSKK